MSESWKEEVGRDEEVLYVSPGYGCGGIQSYSYEQGIKVVP